MNLPNKITLSRIFLIPFFLFFISPIPEILEYMPIIKSWNNFVNIYGNFIGAGIFIIAASTDGIDGYIARKKNLVTKLGVFLDPIADKVMISTALIALVERGYVSTWIAAIIISREFIVTGFRLVASKEDVVISANYLGKLKTVLQILSITFALLNNYPFILITNVPVYKGFMFITTIVTIYSGWKYIYDNIHLLKDSK